MGVYWALSIANRRSPRIQSSTCKPPALSPARMVFPSGEKAQQSSGVCASNMATCAPVSMRQMRRVLSEETETMNGSSGVRATRCTACVCPPSVRAIRRKTCSTNWIRFSSTSARKGANRRCPVSPHANRRTSVRQKNADGTVMSRLSSPHLFAKSDVLHGNSSHRFAYARVGGRWFFSVRGSMCESFDSQRTSKASLPYDGESQNDALAFARVYSLVRAQHNPFHYRLSLRL